ncbi:MAG: hypothetical protein JKY49_14395 [Cohaesibacteraceae bacterium]|nr:hypothetical protein [Cohaesibacteraceae bacterium]
MSNDQKTDAENIAAVAALIVTGEAEKSGMALRQVSLGNKTDEARLKDLWKTEGPAALKVAEDKHVAEKQATIPGFTKLDLHREKMTAIRRRRDSGLHGRINPRANIKSGSGNKI